MKKKIYPKEINYIKSNSFNFNIDINKEMLLNIKALKNCSSINLNSLKINENELSFLNKNCFSSVESLYLSNTGIKSLNFLSFDSLSNLKNLDLSNNEIDDISFLTENNVKCKHIIYFKLSNNKIRKGLEVLKTGIF